MSRINKLVPILWWTLAIFLIASGLNQWQETNWMLGIILSVVFFAASFHYLLKIGEKKRVRRKYIHFRPSNKTKVFFEERLRGWDDWSDKALEMRDEMLSDLLNRTISKDVTVKEEKKK